MAFNTPKVFSYNSPHSWKIALDRIKVKFINCDIDKTQIPDTMVFGKSSFTDIGKILLQNPNIDMFVGEVENDEINARYENLLSDKYRYVTVKKNINKFGYMINREVKIIAGVRVQKGAKDILENFVGMLNSAPTSTKPFKGIWDCTTLEHYKEILRVYRYPQNYKIDNKIKLTDFMDEIMKDSPPDFYRDIFTYIYTASELNETGDIDDIWWQVDGSPST